MFKIHIPGLQYEGETPEQAEERDRRIIEANRKLEAEWQEGEGQRLAPMKSMQKWARDRGILHNAEVSRGDGSASQPHQKS